MKIYPVVILNFWKRRFDKFTAGICYRYWHKESWSINLSFPPTQVSGRHGCYQDPGVDQNSVSIGGRWERVSGKEGHPHKTHASFGTRIGSDWNNLSVTRHSLMAFETYSICCWLALWMALRQLGYRPYHYVDRWLQNHFQLWDQALRAKYYGIGRPWKREEFDAVMGDFDVGVLSPDTEFITVHGADRPSSASSMYHAVSSSRNSPRHTLTQKSSSLRAMLTNGWSPCTKPCSKSSPGSPGRSCDTPILSLLAAGTSMPC